MNYGEEHAYWYLRLNGFFPITNFVIHKSGTVAHSSDCDVLAIRTPHVFEEIGGQEDDWDEWLTGMLDFNRTIGIICEVKTGKYKDSQLFRKGNVEYCIGRLGFVPQQQLGRTANELRKQPFINISSHYQLCKLLIANEGSDTERYFFANLGSIISFIEKRVERYPKDKYGDRMFFSSLQFQAMIDRVVMKRI